METVITEHIETTPGTCGGRPRIAGHRVRVQDIVVCYEQRGMTPGEIVAEYPSITMADVHAALAYYYDHQDEIQKDMTEEAIYASEMRARSQSVLDRKLKDRDAEDHQVPPR